MKPKAKHLKIGPAPKEPKRGRVGRPPLSPDGDTTVTTVRLAPEHVEELEALMKQGKGENLSGAVRFLIEQSRARRRK